MRWLNPTVEKLEVKRAGRIARLEEIRRLMKELEKFPALFVYESLDLAKEVAEIDKLIEQKRKKQVRSIE